MILGATVWRKAREIRESLIKGIDRGKLHQESVQVTRRGKTFTQKVWKRTGEDKGNKHAAGGGAGQPYNPNNAGVFLGNLHGRIQADAALKGAITDVKMSEEDENSAKLHYTVHGKPVTTYLTGLRVPTKALVNDVLQGMKAAVSGADKRTDEEKRADKFVGGEPKRELLASDIKVASALGTDAAQRAFKSGKAIAPAQDAATMELVRTVGEGNTAGVLEAWNKAYHIEQRKLADAAIAAKAQGKATPWHRDGETLFKRGLEHKYLTESDRDIVHTYADAIRKQAGENEITPEAVSEAIQYVIEDRDPQRRGESRQKNNALREINIRKAAGKPISEGLQWAAESPIGQHGATPKGLGDAGTTAWRVAMQRGLSGDLDGVTGWGTILEHRLARMWEKAKTYTGANTGELFAGTIAKIIQHDDKYIGNDMSETMRAIYEAGIPPFKRDKILLQKPEGFQSKATDQLTQNERGHIVHSTAGETKEERRVRIKANAERMLAEKKQSSAPVKSEADKRGEAMQAEFKRTGKLPPHLQAAADKAAGNPAIGVKITDVEPFAPETREHVATRTVKPMYGLGTSAAYYINKTKDGKYDAEIQVGIDRAYKHISTHDTREEARAAIEKDHNILSPKKYQLNWHDKKASGNLFDAEHLK